MKRLVFLAIILLSVVSLNAQIYVKGVPLKHEHKYVLVVIKPGLQGYTPFIEKYVKGTIAPNFKPVTDQDGKKLHFNTVVEVIEFFEKNGFELFKMSTTEQENTAHYYFLFKDTGFEEPQSE